MPAPDQIPVTDAPGGIGSRVHSAIRNGHLFGIHAELLGAQFEQHAPRFCRGAA